MFKKLLFLLIFFLLILVTEIWGSDVVDKAFVYYNTWEMEKVEPAAKELIKKSSLETDEEWFLGVLYFSQGDYKNSIYYLGKVCEKNPDDEKLHSFYNFVEKTYNITKDFQSYESEHFILRLDKRDIILIDYALEALEGGYREIGQDLDCFPERKVLVEIYPDSEGFNWASSLSKRDMEVSGAIGICKFNRLMIVSPRCLAFGYRWLDSVVHEYTHFVVNIKSKGKCPLWLHEGIAKFEEKRWISNARGNYLTPVYSSLLRQALDNKKMITFARMSPSLVKLETGEEVALAFAEVASAVDYIVSVYGIEILPKILEELKSNEKYEEVMAKVLNKNYENFEQDWFNFIEKKNLVIIPDVMAESFKIKDENGDYEMEEYVQGELQTYIRLGDTFKKRDKHQVALQQYKKALKVQSYNPVVLNRIGKTYFILEDFIKAEEFFTEAIRTNPNYVSSYTNLGNLYFYLKDTTKALINYQESNRINPFNPAIHRNMGLIYCQNNKEKAIKEWEIAEKLAPWDLEVRGWIMNLK